VLYLQHFGLSQPPFGITPDTSFFYACPTMQAALNTLLVAAGNGEGFIKITGEVGTGKSLLCRKFLATLDDSWVTAYIPNPDLDPETLLIALAEEMGVKLESSMDQHRLIKSLYLALVRFANNDKRVVVCLDETQAMPLESLETLRLLTNLETEKRKLLQVILFGQPELDEKLGHKSIRQLRQRITFQHRLGTLGRDDLARYLAHRLAVAGYVGEGVFVPAAVRAIYRASRGVPRLVNILAHKSMMLAYGEGTRKVAVRHVRGAAEDTPAVFSRRLPRWIWLALACAAFSSFGWALLR
jgi:MSHA biogenesis protein MshM